MESRRSLPGFEVPVQDVPGFVVVFSQRFEFALVAGEELDEVDEGGQLAAGLVLLDPLKSHQSRGLDTGAL